MQPLIGRSVLHIISDSAIWLVEWENKMAAQTLQELFEQEKGNEKSNEKANSALKKIKYTTKNESKYLLQVRKCILNIEISLK